MALNNFTDEEAIEIVIALRDNLPFDFDEETSVSEKWRDRDALAVVINLATERAKEKKNNGKYIR